MSYPDAPYNEDPPEERIDPSEKPMGFFDHLDELRGTLMKCAVVYVVFAIAIGIYVKRFNDTLMWPYYFVQKWYPLLQLEKLQATEVTEGLSVMMQLCLLGALGPAAPFILFFLGQFVAPALTKKEKRLVLPACFAAFVLFVGGAVFSYFVLVPSTLVFSIELNDLFGWDTRWKPGSYYSLLSWLVIGVGCAFEFPLVIVILVWLGLLEVPTLRKYRRHAVVVIIVIAAAITPTTDPFSLSLFAAPLYVLYEIAILVSSRIVKRKGLLPSS